MSERVAIVGSREWPTPFTVESYVDDLPPGTVVVSGAARGADTIAANRARVRGLEVVEHPAQWTQFGRSAGYQRNVTIVADCDRVVAFWDGSSRGTRHTIEIARAAGKPVLVVSPRDTREGKAGA